MPTFLDVIRLNGGDAAVGLIDEASKATPEVRLGGARAIKGLNYKTNVRTAVPTVGFRRANEGTAIGKSTFEQRLVETYIMNPQFEIDEAAALASDMSVAEYLALEALGITEGAMQALGTAFFYGTDTTYGKQYGFPGLLQCHDDTNMVVDATGTTATTGSSVWLVRFGVQDVSWVLGDGGSVNVSDPVKVRILDSANNPLMVWHQDMLLRPGLQVGSVYSVCRIKKITADSSHTLTDALIYQALAKFPAGKGPNACFMSRRSLYQLRSSRTATNATGVPAPIPTDIEGAPDNGSQRIPIYVTDSLSDVEALTL